MPEGHKATSRSIYKTSDDLISKNDNQIFKNHERYFNYIRIKFIKVIKTILMSLRKRLAMLILYLF